MLLVAAIAATTPMRMIISALNASTRNMPPNAVAGPSARTRMASTTPTALTPSALAGQSHAVTCRQPNPATANPAAAGMIGRITINVSISRAAL